jgi:hypothetical protein
MGIFEQRWCFSLLKTLRGRQYSLIQQTQFTMQSKMLDPLPSNMKDFLRRSTVFLHSLEMGIMYKVEVLHPWKRWEVGSIPLNSKLNSNCKEGASRSCFKHYDSLTQATLHLLFTFVGDFEQRWCFSLLKSLRGRQYSLIQQTQFTGLSKRLDPLPSNMEDFLRRTIVFLYSLEMGIRYKVVPQPWKHWEVGSIPLNSKLKSNCKTRF